MIDGPPQVPGVSGLVEIGRGGFGVVYRGHQGDFGRDVAVKVLLAPGVDPKAVERWRREITAMGRLSNHPNIVAVYSAGVTEQGHPYLLMPFVAGGSLHDRIQRDGAVPPAELKVLGARLAGGLAAAHAAGVLHRDIKPANVLLSEWGEPQLSDFGIARLADAATTTTGSIQATIGYAAPEILSGDTATPAADIYGLGATLHAAASGSAPFAGDDGEPMVARVGRVLTQPPPDLHAVGVPAGLAALIDACLAKDPEHRPASADEVRARLEAVDLAAPRVERTEVLPPTVVAPPVAPSPGPPSEPMALAGGGGGRGAALVAVLVVALLLVGGLAVWALTRDGADAVVTDGTTTTATSTTSTVPAETETTPSSSSSTSSSSTSTTSTSTTTASTTTTSTTTTTTTEPESPMPTAPELEAAATTYYQLVGDGDVDASWALLSPRFQSESGGFDDYREFWTEAIAAVEVVGGPVADEEDGSTSLTLHFTRADGTETTEDVVVGFVTDATGALLVDSYATSGG